MQRPVIHIRLHPDHDKEVRAYAEREHLNVTAVVTLALNQFFAAETARKAQRRTS